MDADPADGVLRNRAVLGDISNQLGKRRFVSVSGNSGLNRGNGCGKNVENETSNSGSACKGREGDENLVRGKCKSELDANVSKKGVSLVRVKRLGRSLNLGSGAKTLQDNAVSSVPRVPSEIKKVQGSLDGNLRYVWGDALTQRVGGSSDELRESSIHSVLMPRGSGQRDKALNSSSLVFGGKYLEEGTASADITGNHFGSNAIKKAVATHACENDEEGVNGDDLALNQFNSIGCSLESGSSGSKVFESEKCAGFKADGVSNANVDVDLLKACTCSFCLKAAYIWTDLHYQDTKGRIAALKRSRKEVRSLTERCCSYGEFDKNGQGSSNDSTKLESDLMGQWRSLFLHTEGILFRESTQLQSSLLTLKELKDSCKADLEINAAPSNNRTSGISGENM